MYIRSIWAWGRGGAGGGVNVYVYLHPEGVPHGGDFAAIARDPGLKYAKITEIQDKYPCTECYLDVILEDADYTPERVDRALGRVFRKLVGDAPNPLRHVVTDRSATVRVAFGIVPDSNYPETKRDLFSLLRETCLEWLKEIPDPRAAA